MYKILFVCHGNICRSPMAEFILKYLVKKHNIANCFEISSAATSTEEIGNDIYPPAKAILKQNNIPFCSHNAKQITIKDYLYYDYIICMDRNNLKNIARIIPNDCSNKIRLLMNFCNNGNNGNDVADPWYTGDFETTYNDILQGCYALLLHLGINLI